MNPIYRYKLTTQDHTTHIGCAWKIGEWKKTDGSGELCGPGWLHCYDHPLLAVLHNPIHADITNPVLWRVEVRGTEKRDYQIKSGWTQMRLVKTVKLPNITINQRIAYGIKCALAVYTDKLFVNWAENWLSGKDRSKESAARAAWAAWAAWAAAEAAAEAAWAAAEAAAETAWATRAAAWAARAARATRAAAWAAAEAAEAAAEAAWAGKIDLLKIAKEAINFEGAQP